MIDADFAQILEERLSDAIAEFNAEPSPARRDVLLVQICRLRHLVGAKGRD